MSYTNISSINREEYEKSVISLRTKNKNIIFAAKITIGYDYENRNKRV